MIQTRRARDRVAGRWHSLGLDPAVSLAVLVCAVLLFGCGPDAAVEAKKHLDTGVAHYQKGELEDAAKAFQQSIKSKPDYAEAHARLGLTYAVLGERDKALAEYEWLEKKKPSMAGRLAVVLADMTTAPRAEGAKEGNEAKKAPAVLRLQEVRVEPAQASAGSSVKIVLEYAVGGAEQAVREERRIERDGSAFGRFADTFFRLPGKKYTSRKSITIPGNAAPGAYTVVGAVSAGGTVKSKRATLQVTAK